jgi:hypothetical protein
VTASTAKGWQQLDGGAVFAVKALSASGGGSGGGSLAASSSNHAPSDTSYFFNLLYHSLTGGSAISRDRVAS